MQRTRGRHATLKPLACSSKLAITLRQHSTAVAQVPVTWLQHLQLRKPCARGVQLACYNMRLCDSMQHSSTVRRCSQCSRIHAVCTLRCAGAVLHDRSTEQSWCPRRQSCETGTRAAAMKDWLLVVVLLRQRLQRHAPEWLRLHIGSVVTGTRLLLLLLLLQCVGWRLTTRWLSIKRRHEVFQTLQQHLLLLLLILLLLLLILLLLLLLILLVRATCSLPS